jgi:hypothetical protein
MKELDGISATSKTNTDLPWLNIHVTKLNLNMKTTLLGNYKKVSIAIEE